MTTRRFLIHLGLLALFVILVFWLTLFALKVYTNHGQKLELPNYIGQNIDDIQADARKRSFRLVVNDSIHKLNTPGGQVLIQNPKPYSQVKENRKIYLTIAKYNAEIIMSEHLPALYGRDYEMKKRELGSGSFSIDLIIDDYVYDNGAPNMILEARYNNKVIEDSEGRKRGVEVEKGGTVHVILSKDSGAEITLPNLVCSRLSQAQFILDANGLKLGSIFVEGEVRDRGSAYIYKQFPAPDSQDNILMGEFVNLYIRSGKPEGCL